MSIEVNNLHFSYGEREVLSGVSFVAEDRQLLSIIGPNGVGKSTLFRCMLGLLKGQGEIIINGGRMEDMSAAQLARHIAYVPQSHYPSFNYSVFDMVLMGTSAQVSSISTPGEKQVKLADAAIERMGIAHLRERGYMHISGGERQLALIARALAQEARVLIMDEPTANLDYGNQLKVLAQIKALTEDGYTIILSTHNPDQAFLFADRVLAISGGRVIRAGVPADVLTSELIYELYGVKAQVHSFYDGTVRVCVPEMPTA